MEGTFDLHVHAFPDVTERLADDLTIARKCREAGMCGIAVKAMQESTTSRAYYVNQLLRFSDGRWCVPQLSDRWH